MTPTLTASPVGDRNYFHKEIRALKIFGLNLTGKKESTSYKIYSFLILSAVNFGYPILDFGEMFKHDFNVVSQILIYEFMFFVGFAKTAVMLRNRLKIGKLLRKLGRKPFIENLERGGDEEEKMLRECLMITNAQTLTYWIITVISFSTTNVYYLLRRLKDSSYHEWAFPYGPLTLLNVTYSPNFEISWIYQGWSVLAIAVHFTTIDLIIAAVLLHISYQFKMLQNNLRRLVHNSYEKMRKDPNNPKTPLPSSEIGEVDECGTPWKYLKVSLKEAVDYHLAIIDIAREMEEVFSSLLLFVFLGTLGMLCFLIYRVSGVSLTDGGIVKNMVEVTGVCWQVLIVCYWGEQVLFESQQVGSAAFEARFIGTDLRFQKGLALVIRRSQNVTQLTAGKFTAVCLPTLAWILQTSYSACMVLRNTKTREM